MAASIPTSIMRGPPSVPSSALTTANTLPPTATGADTTRPKSRVHSFLNGGAAVAHVTRLPARPLAR